MYGFATVFLYGLKVNFENYVAFILLQTTCKMELVCTLFTFISHDFE